MEEIVAALCFFWMIGILEGQKGDEIVLVLGLVPQFPYQKKVNLFGFFVFLSRENQQPKKLKIG